LREHALLVDCVREQIGLGQDVQRHLSQLVGPLYEPREALRKSQDGLQLQEEAVENVDGMVVGSPYDSSGRNVRSQSPEHLLVKDSAAG